jgi:hypothetical protein
MKKLVSFLSFLIIGMFFFGLIYSDPFGSRTQNNGSNDSQNPVVTYSNSIVKFSDDMNGVNDTAGLRSRGFIPKRGPLSGPAGTTPNWFQGNNTVFNAYEGPTTGYVAANYNNVTGDNTIDLWLISPVVNGVINDTISFYERSVAASTFPDSIRVYWASNGDTVPGSGSFVELGRFKTTTSGSWGERRFTLPTAGATGRFAINYRVAHGGPSGANSDYIGVDLVRLLGSITGITPVNNQVPEKYSLSQNYPNPFNPVTNINFSIPTRGLVKLSVFDITGKEVVSLVNEVKPAGNYAVDFNASALSSGIYFYKIEAGNFTQTKKLMLIK